MRRIEPAALPVGIVVTALGNAGGHLPRPDRRTQLVHVDPVIDRVAEIRDAREIGGPGKRALGQAHDIGRIPVGTLAAGPDIGPEEAGRKIIHNDRIILGEAPRRSGSNAVERGLGKPGMLVLAAILAQAAMAVIDAMPFVQITDMTPDRSRLRRFLGVIARQNAEQQSGQDKALQPAGHGDHCRGAHQASSSTKISRNWPWAVSRSVPARAA